MQSEKDRRRNHRLRQMILDVYGRSCACCGETIERFLTLDHIHNDGVHDGKRGMPFYVRLKNAGFPKTVRVLCFNCNCGRALNGGVCPHAIIKA